MCHVRYESWSWWWDVESVYPIYEHGTGPHMLQSYGVFQIINVTEYLYYCGGVILGGVRVVGW